MKNNRICFIGCGNMGRSLIGGLIANGYMPKNICGADPAKEQRQKLRALFDIEVFQQNIDAIKNADMIVLAVKPQLMEATVKGIAAEFDPARPLIISIAAGIRLSAISAWLQQDLAIVRVMPNTPALIQAGATALYANDKTNTAQRESAEMIMRSVGLTVWLDDESLMDVVTALSGSGPAYFFLLMEIMEKAAVKMGLGQKQARLLTLETAFGAAKMAIESESDAATLRRQVTSPGGTTEQALNVLTEANIETLFHAALTAAKQRSIELADTFGGKK
ncbi:MAG: pyrroline-5-carboxylate reductase [Proteobacteria bacterium]|nr:pyrroline-5-carboxylate reductase [Pseudomonadota bacterium]